MDLLPSSIWLATFSTTSGCNSGCLLLLAWLQSTMILQATPVFPALCSQADMHRIVIGSAATAAQDDMAVALPRVVNTETCPAVDAEKRCGFGYRVEGVGRHGQATIGAVLKPTGEDRPAGHLPVGLGFSRAGTNGAPADQVLQVLGRDRVQRPVEVGRPSSRMSSSNCRPRCRPSSILKVIHVGR